MAAVLGLQECDVRVGGDLGDGLGCDVNEGVVECVHDQRGHGDAIHDARGGSAEVIVLRGGEAGVERGDAVVELAQRTDAGGAVRIERPRKEPDLAPEAANEVAQEPPLVETVLRQVQGSGRETEVDGRRHSNHRAQFARRVGAQFPGQLQHQVPAHGVAHQRDALEPLAFEEETHDGADIAREPGVVERRRKLLRTAAVAHVHANDAGARVPQLVGITHDVL